MKVFFREQNNVFYFFLLSDISELLKFAKLCPLMELSKLSSVCAVIEKVQHSTPIFLAGFSMSPQSRSNSPQICWLKRRTIPVSYDIIN